MIKLSEQMQLHILYRKCMPRKVGHMCMPGDSPPVYVCVCGRFFIGKPGNPISTSVIRPNRLSALLAVASAAGLQQQLENYKAIIYSLRESGKGMSDLHKRVCNFFGDEHRQW